MSHSHPPSEANVGELIDFRWGNKRGVLRGTLEGKKKNDSSCIGLQLCKC